MPARRARAPIIALARRQTGAGPALAALERWLEAERDQLPLWLPVALGAGIAAWFGLGDEADWRLFLIVSGGLGLVALVAGWGRRIGQALAWGAFAACLGCALAWVRSEQVATPILARPLQATIGGEIAAVELLPARAAIRVTIALDSGRDPALGLPPRVRIALREAQADPRFVAPLTPGSRIALTVRLAPPAPSPVPGAYGFARNAWFLGLGATGKAMAAPIVLPPPRAAHPGVAERWQHWLDGERAALTRHIEQRLPGNAGGVAAAFITGDVGGIDLGASDDFRSSGLAHLLSISGLHVAAAIAAAMVLTLRLLALSPWLALRAPLPLIAAGAGAVAGLAYTLLSGAEVPTVRSCVAALLVLGGLALGREALTLRLVAAGALIVLLFRPEALVGPSFQLSFAAVTAIIAFADHPRVRAFALKRDEPLPWRLGREILTLLATGLLVEAALSPIGLYFFQRAGVYGAFANIVAIPLSTFVILPVEALALLGDLLGIGLPIWWLAGRSLDLLLWIAHAVGHWPGAVRALPSMPVGAYLAMVVGGLWIALWRSKARRLGLVPLAAGALWALLTPAPDLLVTGDGRHVAVRDDDGGLRLLRPNAGPYVRDLLGWGAGIQAEALDLDSMAGARCSPAACVASLTRGGRSWHLLAIRSHEKLAPAGLATACRWADIAVAEDRLPGACRPRWLRLDAPALAQSGGVAIALGARRVVTVNGDDHHPWVLRGVPRADFAFGGVRQPLTGAAE